MKHLPLYLPLYLSSVGILVLLAGCTTTSLNEAPIVDRSERRGTPGAAAPTRAPAREVRDGTYIVQRGDTLYSIALAVGQDYRDLARWNGLDDPSRLQPGQTLRVQAPADGSGGPAVAAVPVAPVAAAEVRPLDAPAVAPPAAAASPGTASGTPVAPAAASGTTTAPAAAVAAPSASAPAAPASAPAPSSSSAASPKAEPKAVPPAAAASGIVWTWPAGGKVIEPFDDSRNKGIDIGGAEGDPVHAAGDGQVVYRGNGLRGYGNLVIIKHSDEFISAYAHNRQILVEQGQTVKRGQRIAELGKTDADLPKLHFEVRRQGKPVDPLKYLPAR
jgi:lipoprotein NlpD